MEWTAGLVTDPLRPGGHADVFYTAHQVANLHRLFAEVPSTQPDGSSFPSSSGSKETVTVRAISDSRRASMPPLKQPVEEVLRTCYSDEICSVPEERRQKTRQGGQDS